MFVKLGQMLSTRPDIVSPGLARELTRLQEHVAPADPEAVRALVELEIGRPVAEACRMPDSCSSPGSISTSSPTSCSAPRCG